MKKINEGFFCINCGKYVPPAPKTSRNHCPRCFFSLHVDDKIPGDRASHCQGIMKPVAYKVKGDRIKVLFRCEKCGKEHWNKLAEDDNIQALIKIIGG